MIKTLLDKIYAHNLDEHAHALINILIKDITDLQVRALYELDSEVDELIEDLDAHDVPPTLEQLAEKFPAMQEGCEE